MASEMGPSCGWRFTKLPTQHRYWITWMRSSNASWPEFPPETGVVNQKGPAHYRWGLYSAFRRQEERDLRFGARDHQQSYGTAGRGGGPACVERAMRGGNCHRFELSEERHYHLD